MAASARVAEGLEPGSPFGPNLRAFVIYPRSVQGIPLARLSHVLRDLFGLDISEGALVNILDASRGSFAAQTNLIKARLLAGAALASDEMAHKAGHKLQTIIKKVRRHLFVFVTNREITATNNGSERALRPCVIYRKITNGFRSQWGAALYADIRSVVETARRRSIRAIDAIRLTLEGRPIPCAA